MKEIRWIAQASRKGLNDWRDRDDVVYTGWFHFTDSNVPEAVINCYHAAVDSHDWLDWRLVRDIRTREKTVIEQHLRD